jgi:hypothetical protein
VFVLRGAEAARRLGTDISQFPSFRGEAGIEYERDSDRRTRRLEQV